MRIADVSRSSSVAWVGLALLLAGCAQSTATQSPATPKPPVRPSTPRTGGGPPAGESADSKGEKRAEAGEKQAEGSKPATAKGDAASEARRSGASGTGEGAAAGATTPDEQRSAIDGKLQASMSEFDGMLLKEQKALEEKQRRDPLPERGEGTGGSGAAKEGSSGSGGGKGGNAGKEGSAESRDDRTPAERRAEAEARKGAGEKGSTAPGTADQGTGSSNPGRTEGGAPVTAPVEGGPAGPGGDSSAVPRDVGDGKNDDVVARQLREAAMKEKDPAIRAKLWDEYREYKKSAGKGGD